MWVQNDIVNAIGLKERNNKQKSFINVGVVEACGDALVSEEQFEIITNIPSPFESTFTLVDQITSSGRIKNFNEENMTSRNGHVLMKLAKATEVQDCNRTLDEALSLFDRNFYLDTLDFLKKVIFFERHAQADVRTQYAIYWKIQLRFCALPSGEYYLVL